MCTRWPVSLSSSTGSVRSLVLRGILSLMSSGPDLLPLVGPARVERDGQILRDLGMDLRTYPLRFVLFLATLVSLCGLLVLARGSRLATDALLSP